MGEGRRRRDGRRKETYRPERDEDLEVGRKFTQRRRKEI